MLDPMLTPELLRPERVRGLRRDEYEQLIKLGAFGDERIELLRGSLVEMSPQGEPHARICAWLHQQLVLGLDTERYEVRGHSSFAATGDSVPEPDVAVLRRAMRPRLPRKALLLIEVLESSLVKDRVLKTEIYAEGGVPEYWIVNVRTQTVEVRTRPSAAGYRDVATLEAGDVLRPVKLRGFTLDVSHIPWGTQRARVKRR